jgi:hypothetical protein
VSAYSQKFALLGWPKVAVFTAVTNGYDLVHPPTTHVASWDYICFSDKADTDPAGWQVRALPENDLDLVRRSRWPKILAHHFLADYDISIWVDANVRIVGDLMSFCEIALADGDIAFFRHGDYRSSVAAEIQACVKYGKAPLDVMMHQYEHYRRQGFPDNAGIIPEAGVIVRRHHLRPIEAAMEEWWMELLSYSARDQISLPYVIWRNSLKFTLLDWDLRKCPWFVLAPHSR